jgi:hypothetical protein
LFSHALPKYDDYAARDPSSSLLHKLVCEHFSTLKELSNDHDDPSSGLPAFVVKEFESFVGCGILARGFARLRCSDCKWERLLAFSCGTRTLCPSCSARRMHHTAAFLVERVLPDVPIRQWVISPPFPLVGLLGARHELLSDLRRIFIDVVFRWMSARAQRLGIQGGKSGAINHIQRFSNSLLLYPHHHALVLDGVFTRDQDGEPPRFHPLPPPSERDMTAVALRFARLLARRGLVREPGDDTDSPTPLEKWYMTVLSERAGFAFVDDEGNVHEPEHSSGSRASSGEAGGFSVDARVSIPEGDHAARERLCRYVARPPLAEAQLSMTNDGRVAVRLRKKNRGGETHVVLEPLVFLRRLAWIVPSPGKNLLTFHGVLAPGAAWRKDIVPAQVQLKRSSPALAPIDDPAPVRSAKAIAWAKLLKHVGDIDPLACERCGGELRPIAVIQDLAVARKILRHLGLPADLPRFAPSRGPP